jgi:hypothetical protein
MKQFITEAERLQKLAGITEIKITPSVLGKPEIPEGWEQYEVDPEPDEEENMEAEVYYAPMEGWDENHYDSVFIMKTPNIDTDTGQPLKSKYYVKTYMAFGDFIEGDEKYDSYLQAKQEAIEIMNDIKKDWR